MKIIFSYVTNNNAPSQSSVELAALSNFLVKKQNLKTVFFGDKIAISNFKNIEYDEFVELKDDELLQLPPSLWSMNKLMAVRQINEPFLHLDCDMLLFKDLHKLQYDHDIVCFHDEYFIDHHFQTLQDLFQIKPEQCNNYITRSYNCGIFGGNDYQSYHKAIDILFEFIKNNYTHIEYISSKYRNDKNLAKQANYDFFHPPVLVEQIWMFQLLQSFGKQIHTIMQIHNWHTDFENKSKESGFIHLMHRKEYYAKQVQFLLKRYNIKY
jgi:hypothetical protein